MSAPTIIANTCGLELTSSRAFNNEYLYQAGKTIKQIYTCGTDYFCVSVTRPTDEVGLPWEKYPDQFWAEKSKKILWISKLKESKK